MDEVIERANKTTYGLAAGILTKNLENALVFAHAVEAGSVWVNCFLAVTCQAPVCICYFFKRKIGVGFSSHLLCGFNGIYFHAFQFGGYKQSGLGREAGEDVLDLYQETKTVSIALPINH